MLSPKETAISRAKSTANFQFKHIEGAKEKGPFHTPELRYVIRQLTDIYEDLNFEQRIELAEIYTKVFRDAWEKLYFGKFKQ